MSGFRGSGGVEVIDGSCHRYCSVYGYCGQTCVYLTNGTDCTVCDPNERGRESMLRRSARRDSGRDIREKVTVAPSRRHTDCQKMQRWSQRRNVRNGTCHLPRVLIITYTTEGSHSHFQREAYWKACYAHLHGFDAVFEVGRNGPGRANDGVWDYSLKRMFEVWRVLSEHLSSAKYDYVLITGADVLFSRAFLEFPLWLLDQKGRSLTVMDNGFDHWGFNENNLLFRTDTWSATFAARVLKHSTLRANSLQGDNGPYMEEILVALGHEADASGRSRGYSGRCTSLLRVSDTVAADFAGGTVATPQYIAQNLDYSSCFFEELDRLAGPAHARDSMHIGFNSRRDVGEDQLPWANCWHPLRLGSGEAHAALKRCLAFHWNGFKNMALPYRDVMTPMIRPMFSSDRDAAQFWDDTEIGQCPDPSFDWAASSGNIMNWQYCPANVARLARQRVRPTSPRS